MPRPSTRPVARPMAASARADLAGVSRRLGFRAMVVPRRHSRRPDQERRDRDRKGAHRSRLLF
ncbi:hypothetical protein AB1L88_16965 [Tautonia sp. JC769]|uniref:hypothetical protein n=1 Tax=Tautonia sp. JC769 TaxID=3232135 RepID=UPI003458894C